MRGKIKKALSLARCLEKTTFKLEAHHCHLHFSQKALQNQFVPKSLRFKPPDSHPVFQQIMDRASKHCLWARINLCHHHIKTSKDNINSTKHELSSLINEDTYSTLMSFLKSRATSFHNNINARHAKKLATWIVLVFKKPTLTRTTGLWTSPRNHFYQRNNLSRRKALNLPQRQLHVTYHIRILWLKSKLPSATCLMIPKMLSEQVLLPFSIEHDYRHTITFPKRKEKL